MRRFFNQPDNLNEFDFTNESAANLVTDVIDIGRGDRKIFVTSNGDIAGELFLYPENGHLHIELVKVKSNYRGQGIAGLLLEKAVAIAKAERKDLTLMASPVGKDASLSKDQLVKLYGKYGFKVTDNEDELNTYMIRRH